jgi:hypothetical protein
MADLVRIGSETAKGGFANERDIAEKFKAWKTDREARKWLARMHYNLDEIESIDAYVIHGHKTDVQVKVIVKLKKGIGIENLSVKKANKNFPFNQVDKRPIDHYKKMWDIPNDIVTLLKIFTGEIQPSNLLKTNKITQEKYASLRDKRRFFLTDFNEQDRRKIIEFFKRNKMLVVTDIIKGNDEYAADWMLVTLLDKAKNETSWALTDINKAISIFERGDIKVSPQGSLYIGNIFMQRKGGTPDPNSLQFKINPSILFDS